MDFNSASHATSHAPVYQPQHYELHTCIATSVLFSLFKIPKSLPHKLDQEDCAELNSDLHRYIKAMAIASGKHPDAIFHAIAILWALKDDEHRHKFLFVGENVYRYFAGAYFRGDKKPQLLQDFGPVTSIGKRYTDEQIHHFAQGIQKLCDSVSIDEYDRNALWQRCQMHYQTLVNKQHELLQQSIAYTSSLGATN
ncbi:hypothetical protein BDQ17DRAFT_1423496 [Cyathus striatus]|nr:hypothetical protein BDQ17DRAFT_1423496 [Cyathus striatus]